MFKEINRREQSELANSCVKLWNAPCLLIGPGNSSSVISFHEDRWECSQMSYKLCFVLVIVCFALSIKSEYESWKFLLFNC